MGLNFDDSSIEASPHRYPQAAVEQQAVYSFDSSSEDSRDELPTDEELHTLRRVADTIPWRVYTIAFVELCERFSYYGTTVVCKPPPSSPLRYVR